VSAALRAMTNDKIQMTKEIQIFWGEYSPRLRSARSMQSAVVVENSRGLMLADRLERAADAAAASFRKMGSATRA
jgi:hypothetical protein